MASNIEFVEFICSQLQELGHIRFRKMFGTICKRKAVILVSDNTAYVKMLSGIANQMTEAETGIPYESAKPHYIIDVEHKDFLIKIVRQLENDAALSQREGEKETKHKFHFSSLFASSKH